MASVNKNTFGQDEEEDHENEASCCQKFGTIVLNIIKEVTDLKLLIENFAFLLIVASNLFIFLGYFLPFIYIPIRAMEINPPIENFAWVLSIIGKNIGCNKTPFL